MGLKFLRRVVISALIFSTTLTTSSAVYQGIITVQANEKISINDYLKNFYENVFGREIDQQGLNYWSEKLSSKQIKLKDFLKNLLSEDEFNKIASTVDLKIEKLYTGIFQRKPDKDGFDFWSSKYNDKLANKKNEIESLKEIIDEMTDGNEFKEISIKLGLDSDKNDTDKSDNKNTTSTQNISNEYKAAVAKAKQYAETLHMSKEGVYQQLVSPYGEKFTEDAARYAVNNIEIDWKENALIKARQYQETLNMSTDRIYEQLISPYGEQFTEEEAQYAIDNL